MINRRHLLQLSAGASASVLLGSPWQQKAFAQNAPLAVQNLNASTVLITGSGCNVIARKAGNGELLVVDGGLDSNAKGLRKLIEDTLDSRKFTTLINTHWHREQTG